MSSLYTRGSTLQAEKPLLVISIFFALSWVVSAVLTAKNGIQVTPFYFEASSGFFLLIAANVGAVIMPFMLFYQASATAEKGITVKSLWAIRFETGVGAFVSELIMVAILIATVGVSTDSLQFATPGILSRGLASVAGSFAPYVFSIGLIAAAFIALIVISLGSCWGVTEALGWGRKNWFKVYLVESIPGTSGTAAVVQFDQPCDQLDGAADRGVDRTSNNAWSDKFEQEIDGRSLPSRIQQDSLLGLPGSDIRHRGRQHGVSAIARIAVGFISRKGLSPPMMKTDCNYSQKREEVSGSDSASGTFPLLAFANESRLKCGICPRDSIRLPGRY